MKKLLLILISLCLAFCFGCDVAPSESSSEVDSSPAESEITSEYESSTSNAESSTVSVFVPEEKYTFLTSKYYVQTKTQIHDVTYVYRYYLVKGRVAGAMQTIVLLSNQAARSYYDSIVDEYPDAIRNGAAVTFFLEGEDLNYSGYSYQKLKFMLEKTETRYIISFDEKDYLNRYGSVITD